MKEILVQEEINRRSLWVQVAVSRSPSGDVPRACAVFADNILQEYDNKFMGIDSFVKGLEVIDSIDEIAYKELALKCQDIALKYSTIVDLLIEIKAYATNKKVKPENRCEFIEAALEDFNVKTAKEM